MTGPERVPVRWRQGPGCSRRGLPLEASVKQRSVLRSMERVELGHNSTALVEPNFPLRGT